MKYVYILQSLSNENRYYTGLTDDVEQRLKEHNTGRIKHTSKFMLWRLKTYLAFGDENKAIAFETYLKSGSGRAFAKKRL